MSLADAQFRLTISTLYSDHHRWLLGWLHRKLGCPQDAADIAHDTFARLLSAQQGGTSFDPAALRQPRAYLTTTATRLLIDNSRRRAIERSYLQTLAILQLEEASAPSPEHLHEIVETLSAIAQLLEDLPEKPRMAFLLYRLDGLSQAEIAAQLKVSVSRVKQYIAQVMVHCYAAQYGL